MRVLCIGDIVGKPGREAVNQLLKPLKEELAIDFVVINAENSAGGSGLTSRIAKQLTRAGADIITLGDHVWDQKELQAYLDEADNVIRPANFPDGAPGKGWCVAQSSNGQKVGVINLLGRVFMRYSVECPFQKLKQIVHEVKKITPIIIVDMHAETTSEKVALGHFIDGEISFLFGTHTHIQTADEKILAKGTAYITDLGMTGPYDSVIGQEKNHIIKRFLTSMPTKFQVATENILLNGAVVNIDESTGKATAIERLQKKLLLQDKPKEN